MKINLGCGRNPMTGYVNIDRTPLPGVDVVTDLDQLDADPLPFEFNSVDEIVGIDLLEHIPRPLPLMQELWRVAKPGAICRFELPYGSSDDAWEDPTHVRPYFIGSWMYFAQPTYYRASYGYFADWRLVELELHIREGYDMADVMMVRNAVVRQVATLEAVKPARKPDQSLMEKPNIKLLRVR